MNKTQWLKKYFLVFVIATTLFGLGHHLEHIIRNDTGWPFIPELSPFTFSFLIYPLVLIGFIISRKKINYVYWAFVAITGFVMVLFTHLGIIAEESFTHMLEHYQYSLGGYIALFEVILLLVSALITFFVSLYLRKIEKSESHPLNDSVV